MRKELTKTPNPPSPAPAGSAPHHDYTKRYWGHDYTFDPVDGGMRGHMMGWGEGIEAGHFLITQNGENSTRYKVDAIRYMNDPPDMWSADVSFAPRTQPNSSISPKSAAKS